jgi:hypothetical protein
VRTIRKVSEAEVLDCFWQAELAESSRWTDDEVEERKRTWRKRSGLFHGFPHDVAWKRVALTPDEVLAVLYINWDWWLRVSNGTRLATVATEVQGRDDGDRAIAAAVDTNPELIVVTDEAHSRLVLLEGHVRLTAYAAFPEYLPAELELYLGTSETIAGWSEY